MFKRHALQIKLVKATPEENETISAPATPIDYDNITEVAVKRLVVGIVIVLASAAVLTVAKEVAINKLTH